jgi:hypothetical protein
MLSIEMVPRQTGESHARVQSLFGRPGIQSWFVPASLFQERRIHRDGRGQDAGNETVSLRANRRVDKVTLANARYFCRHLKLNLCQRQSVRQHLQPHGGGGLDIADGKAGASKFIGERHGKASRVRGGQKLIRIGGWLASFARRLQSERHLKDRAAVGGNTGATSALSSLAACACTAAGWFHALSIPAYGDYPPIPSVADSPCLRGMTVLERRHSAQSV